jgi:hypothetical protein
MQPRCLRSAAGRIRHCAQEPRDGKAQSSDGFSHLDAEPATSNEASASAPALPDKPPLPFGPEQDCFADGVIEEELTKKRIFVDYLRNSREATAVAPYSTRARPGAPVSTPLSWEKLGTVTSADRYTVLNLPQRLARLRKDPWADIGKLKQALPKK